MMPDGKPPKDDFVANWFMVEIRGEGTSLASFIKINPNTFRYVYMCYDITGEYYKVKFKDKHTERSFRLQFFDTIKFVNKVNPSPECGTSSFGS